MEQYEHAGKTVIVNFKPPMGKAPSQPQTAVVEDYWMNVFGKSWMFSDGNPAALNYALRSGVNGLPINDDVVYAKINGLGHLVHTSEISLPNAVNVAEVLVEDVK